ncbi:MAG TPA: hypothetical protein VK508_22345 [Cyclobacteriaceae bacterium]|nr:hypothetical protein [Cyclobacteriaceae bacterium]
MSLQRNGLLIYGLFITEGGNAIELIRLDTTFKEVWKGYIQVDKNLVLYYSTYLNDRIYMLLKDRFNPTAEFQILSVYIENGGYVMRNVKTMIPFIPTHFVVTPEAALIGGHFNYRPLVLYHSFNLGQSKVLPGFFNEAGELDQLRADEEGNIDVVVSGKNQTKRRSLWIRNYDKTGSLVKTIVLQPDEDKNLIYGRSVSKPGGEQVVCGVYGRYTDYSRGIFIATINPYGEYKINYYNFADLQRFFNFMKARREQRVKERIERRRIRGKKLRFNYRVLVSELMPYGDNQFVMLGEAFYPHYSYPSATRPTGRFNQRYIGTPGYRGDLIFDGYQYTHAVVIGFDKDGTLRWDNSFEINDVRTFQLQQFVRILPHDDKISLLYLFDNVIRSKIIKDAEVLEGKSYDPLTMAFKSDFIKDRDTRQAQLEYWYDDVFYATGIQQVRNLLDAGVNMSREVFFVNKIKYK